MTPKTQKIKSERRILLFRFLTVISLIATGVLCATFGYILLFKGEDEFYTRQYKSLSNNLFRTLIDGINARISAGRSYAAIYSGYCPSSSSWPQCWIPYETFEKMTSSLGISLNMLLTGLLPIVRPSEVESFERFAQQILINESYPASAGYTSGEFGIFSLNSSTKSVYHDTTGENPWNPHGVLVPYFQYEKSLSEMIMYNALSAQSQALPLNLLMTCSDLQLSCNASVSDILKINFFNQDAPATVMFVPITPMNNESDLVAFLSIYICWSEILQSGVPSVTSDIFAILSSGQTKMTFYYKRGRAEYRGIGDHHDRKFDHHREQFDFSLTGTESYLFNYSITLYPAQQFYDTYHTETPFYVCLFSLLIVLATSMIFLLYDFFAKTESLQQSRILEAKQAYVRFISHEIRTPLNIVFLGMQAIRSDLGTITETIKKSLGATNRIDLLLDKLTEADALVEDMTESSSAAVIVLNDLITYDKIENRTLIIEAKQVSPITLLTSTIRSLQVQAKHSQVKLEFVSEFHEESDEIVQREMSIIGDHVKLDQVIRNVVLNALKFSSSGDIVQVIARYRKDGLPSADLYQFRKSVPEDYKYLFSFVRCGSLVIDVVDHGPGMDQDEISRLFKKGVQFNPNQLQAGQGSGLGLWISKGVIELHMGRLSAFSAGPGKGSTFTIEIPLIERPSFLRSISDRVTEEPEHRLEHTPPSCLDSSEENHESKVKIEIQLSRILVVDDAATNRKIVRRVLRSDGYTDVDEAKDGLECIEKVSSHSPSEPWYDVILMDYEMPRMNGPDATSRLRKLGYKMPIIGVTGNLLKEDVAHFLACGADFVLPKPVIMQDLYECYAQAMTARLNN